MWEDCDALDKLEAMISVCVWGHQETAGWLSVGRGVSLAWCGVPPENRLGAVGWTRGSVAGG